MKKYILFLVFISAFVGCVLVSQRILFKTPMTLEFVGSPLPKTEPVDLQNTNSAKPTGNPDEKNAIRYMTNNFVNKENKLSTETIFQYIDPEQAGIKDTNPEEYTIIATGDVIPARSVNSTSVQLNNFHYPFEKTVDFLKNADVVFIDLESPLVSNCKSTIEGMIFCGDVRNVQGLVYAGVTVASIANNHIGNYGIEGIDSTLTLLKQNHIHPTGNGVPAIVTVRDKKFGFLGYNNIGHQKQGIAWADQDQIQKDIEILKKQVDFVIVTFHWGVEYTLIPDSSQKDVAHRAIDAGADLIIGNHPHWVQGVELYKGKLITYAHGNFVFDQMWSQETREGVLGKYVFNKNGLVNVGFFPIVIENYAQPRFANIVEANKILHQMKQSSSEIMRQVDN